MNLKKELVEEDVAKVFEQLPKKLTSVREVELANCVVPSAASHRYLNKELWSHLRRICPVYCSDSVLIALTPIEEGVASIKSIGDPIPK